jgi:hypothetical protein
MDCREQVPGSTDTVVITESLSTRIRRENQMADFDIHIRGGTIVDGTRVPRYRGDVWIRNDRIAQLGRHASGSAHETIDADGLNRRSRLRRFVHALRRSDSLGSVVHLLGMARRNLRGARQLRVRFRPGQARVSRTLDAPADRFRFSPNCLLSFRGQREVYVVRTFWTS